MTLLLAPAPRILHEPAGPNHQTGFFPTPVGNSGQLPLTILYHEPATSEPEAGETPHTRARRLGA